MAIKMKDLTLRIAGKKICESLNVNFERGDFWAVLGVNGVGKSTLLHYMIDIEQAKANEIIIDNKPLPDYASQRKLLAQKAGILLQDYEYNFPCTVMEMVLIGRHPFVSHWRWEGENDIEIAEAALSKCGLLEYKNRSIDTLSGGEMRRLNIATLLAQNPDYYLLDEPTNHLDIHAQVTMLALIQQHIHDHNKTAIMVIHDANLANRYCNKVLMLFGNGEWQAGTTTELINAQTLARLYGCSIKTYSNNEQIVYLPE